MVSLLFCLLTRPERILPKICFLALPPVYAKFYAQICQHRVIINDYCVTLDPNIKETTQTTNQIKCEWALSHPLSLTNLHTLKQVAVGYYKESWGKQDLLRV